MKLTLRFKGGAGSGHHGHSGRPGKHGGSSPSGGGGSSPGGGGGSESITHSDLSDGVKASMSSYVQRNSDVTSTNFDRTYAKFRAGDATLGDLLSTNNDPEFRDIFARTIEDFEFENS